MNELNKEFVPYDEAFQLKELGFDESTYCWRQHGNGISGDVEGKRDYYNRKGDIYTALPLYQQAFRWFREKYNILATIYSNASGYLYEWHDAVGGTHRGWSEYEGPNDSGVWDTYEEAELACIRKLIEIVKKRVKNVSSNTVLADSLPLRECSDCGTKFKSNGRCPECNPMG